MALKERKATEKLKTSSQRCKRCEILEVVLYLLVMMGVSAGVWLIRWEDIANMMKGLCK